MQLDIKKAILLPFSGKDWFLRLIVLSILSLTGFDSSYRDILGVHVVLIMLMVLYWGYYSQYAHNIFNNISVELPSWKLDFKRYFKLGFICLVGFVIVMIIFGLIFWPLGALFEKFNSGYLKVLYEATKQFIVIFMMFVIPCLYAKRFKFIDMLNFSKLLKIISNAKFEFLTCILIYFVSNKLIQFVFPFLKFAYIQIILTSFLWAIVYIVLFDLLIQSFLLTKQQDNTVFIEDKYANEKNELKGIWNEFKDSFKTGIPYPFNMLGEKLVYNSNFEGTEIEKELSKWNWGAFFLNWFWGIFNKSYLTLFALIPLLGAIWAIVCGIKGNEWAWRNKKWESIEHFRKDQREWAMIGTLLIGIPSISFLLIFIFGTIIDGVKA